MLKLRNPLKGPECDLIAARTSNIISYTISCYHLHQNNKEEEEEEEEEERKKYILQSKEDM